VTHPNPKCTLSVLFASGADRAVIFRRGPSRHVCMIAWDMVSDTFEIGQWFKGRVYPESSALSPDGKWIVTALGSFKPPLWAWSALSQPPYFTAHTVWSTKSTYFGSAEFVRNNVLRMSETPVAPGFSVPPWLTLIRPGDPVPEEPVRNSHPWRRTRETVPSEPDFDWWWDVNTEEFGIWGPDGFVPVRGSDWTRMTNDGDLIFAIGGRLYHTGADRLRRLRGPDDAVRQGRLLADFTDLTFRPLQAPAQFRPKDRPMPHHTWDKVRPKRGRS